MSRRMRTRTGWRPRVDRRETRIARSGEPLTTAGQFELINDLDVKPARWVHNVTSITLHTPAE